MPIAAPAHPVIPPAAVFRRSMDYRRRTAARAFRAGHDDKGSLRRAQVMAWSVLDWRKSPGKSASQPRNNFDRCKGRPYDCAPMSSTPLPKQVDIRKLIAVDTTLSAREPLDKFERLADMLMSTDGDVDVHLHLYRDKQGIKRIDGEVKAQLQVQCQRCMQPLTLPVDSIFAVAVVWSDDEASRLPKEVEPY